MRTRPQTVADVLQHVMRNEAQAWSAVETAALRVTRRLRRRYGLDEAACEDVAHDAMLAAIDKRCAALRRADPTTPLDAWLTVTAKNLIRRRLAKERPTARRGLEDADAIVVANDADDQLADRTPTERVVELLELLTPEQRRVEAALLDERSERKAAARLGVSRDHVHDVKRRAMKRMRSAAKWTPDGDRSWAREAAECAASGGDAENARLLRMYSEGRTRTEIAAHLGLTTAAVRGRVSRARQRR